MKLSKERWRDAWFWYRNAPNQTEAVNTLYNQLEQIAPELLTEESEWFCKYTERCKFVKSFMNPEGE